MKESTGVALEVSGEGQAALRLYDGETQIAGSSISLPTESEAVLPVDHPRLWSAEKPFLYRLSIEVFDASGALTETVWETVGLRRFEIRDGLMLLNGRRIRFQGVNRHEFSSRTGRCVTEAETELDIRTMKQNNINAIRTSHYPNQSFFYRLCDKYGMDPQVWDGNVERALLMKSKPEYYNDPVVKYGYCRGSEPVAYVRDIMEFYDSARREIQA